MSDNSNSRCARNTDELQDGGYLHVHEIIRKKEGATYVLRWTIRNYMRLLFGVQYNAHHIRIGKTLHRLRIIKHDTKNRTLPSNKLVYVYLGLTPAPSDANVAITILQSDREEIRPLPNARLFFLHANKKCFSRFVEPPEFLSCVNNPTVICRITVQREDDEVFVEKNCSIPNDLRDLFLDGRLSDLTIQVGDSKFEAHSAILAARSPVFDAMLRSEMKEKTERTLVIVDFEAESFRELLWYLYTGRTNPLSVDSALPLLQLADKYHVQELKSDLEEFLRSNMSFDRVLRILSAADLCNSGNLKREAIEFVFYNLKGLMKGEEWKTFRVHFDLVDEILMYVHSQCPV